MLKGGGKRREKFGLKADRREILGGEEKIKEKKGQKSKQNVTKISRNLKCFDFHSRGVLLLFFSFSFPPFYPKFLDVVVGWGGFPLGTVDFPI